MIISPLKNFSFDAYVNPIVLTPAYVQVVVKNAVTGATLKTLNLTDKGSGYFQNTWTTPGDLSGTGLQIVAFTSVYTDAAYTLLAPQFSVEIEKYIVRDLPGIRGTGAAVYQPDIDYKKIKEMIDGAIASIPAVEMPEMPDEYDDSATKEALTSLSAQVLELVKNEADKAILGKIEALQGELSALKASLKDENNNESVRSSYLMDCVERIENSMKEMMTMEAMEEHKESMMSAIGDVQKQVKEPVKVNLVKDLQKAIGQLAETQGLSGQREEPAPVDEAKSRREMTVSKLINGY